VRRVRNVIKTKHPPERREHNTLLQGADWIHVTQDRVQWRELVSTVMNISVP
jgi:hypothetical protein